MSFNNITEQEIEDHVSYAHNIPCNNNECECFFRCREDREIHSEYCINLFKLKNNNIQYYPIKNKLRNLCIGDLISYEYDLNKVSNLNIFYIFKCF